MGNSSQVVQMHTKGNVAMDSSHHLLLAQVASLYYEEALTQSQIGSKLDLSRVKVYRLLKEAKEKQVVRIKINWPVERHLQLEQALKESFDLREAFVMRTSLANGGIPILAQLGQLGAHYLEQLLTDEMALAICMGRSTYEVIQAISPDFQAHVRVAQATGSIPFTVQEMDSAALARQLAEKLGGEVHYLSSPLVADNIEAADMLRTLRDIKRTLVAAGQSDVALVGIGNLDSHFFSFVKTSLMTPDLLADLNAAGAVGDMGGQILTLSGDPLPGEYNRRIIGITLDDLRRIPTVIAVAAGREKAQAILGALRTHTIDVLCTDDRAAREILGQ